MGLYGRASAFFLTSSLVLGACGGDLESRIEPGISPVPLVQTATYTPEPTPTLETNNDFELADDEFYVIDEYWDAFHIEEDIFGCIVLLSVNDKNQIEQKQNLLRDLERIDSMAWQDESESHFLSSQGDYLNAIQEIDENLSDEEYVAALADLYGIHMGNAIQKIYYEGETNLESGFLRVLPYIDATVDELSDKVQFGPGFTGNERGEIFSELFFTMENVVNLASAPVLDEYDSISEGAVSREFVIEDRGVCDTLYVGDYSKILPEGAIPYDESYETFQGQDA